MFEELGEMIVLGALAFDIAVTVLLALIANKWHRKYEFLKSENEIMYKKMQVLQTGNDIIRDALRDVKKRNLDIESQRAALARENQELSQKLSSTQKKLSNFSRLINDMKNS